MIPRPQKIFICEFITGGGLIGQPLPSVLASEGDMMLQAALADFCALDGISITTTRDPRMPTLNQLTEAMIMRDDPWAQWRHCISAADAALIIAPETGGVLERFNRMVEDAGKLLIGCSSAIVALTTSKIETVRALAHHGVAVPETVYFGQRLPEGGREYVVKPDDGAGSEDTYFFEDSAALSRWDPPDVGRTWIVQSYVPGAARSLALLCGHGRTRVLAVNEQMQIRKGGALKQIGTLVNAHPQQRAVMQGLADQLINLLPGLGGFVGVDYIETVTGPVILEINPRITTSYVPMSRSLDTNIAQLILDACLGQVEAMTCTLAAHTVRVEVPHLA